MQSSSRRQFLEKLAVLTGVLATGTAFRPSGKQPLLSFSTLGCPNWSFEQIIQFAVEHGYQGLELRGLGQEIDVTQSPEFSTAAARKATTARLKAAGLRLVNLGSSTSLHHPEGPERAKHLADGKRFIDLAAEMACPFVRVFPNNLPKDSDKKEVLHRISKGLQELGDYAGGKNVMVLMETHGDVVWTDDLVYVMATASHPHVGLVWDVSNMWTVTKESPTMAYQRLRKYIHHTHIKDARFENGKLQYTLLGEGEVPIFEAVKVLEKDGYKGFYSFEWEKRWHPEIAEPEVALAHYPKAMRKGR